MSETLPPHATRGLSGEAVTIPVQQPELGPTARDRPVLATARSRMAEPPIVEVLPHDTEYVTVQHLAPYLIGLLRGLYLGIFGAIGGLLIGLQMGSRDWDDLLWGMLIGFAGGFIGRGAEAVVIDTPKATSVTEKI